MDQEIEGPSGHHGYMQKCVGMVLVTEQLCTHCDSEVVQKHLQRAWGTRKG